MFFMWPYRYRSITHAKKYTWYLLFDIKTLAYQNTEFYEILMIAKFDKCFSLYHRSSYTFQLNTFRYIFLVYFVQCGITRIRQNTTGKHRLTLLLMQCPDDMSCYIQAFCNYCLQFFHLCYRRLFCISFLSTFITLLSLKV